MTATLSNPDAFLIAAVAGIMFLGGFVKGTVGFALPMVALTGLSLLLTAQESIALLLLPSALSNLWQTLRQGWRLALTTFSRFWQINLAMALALATTAQLVPRIDSELIFAILGVTVTLVAGMQLIGWRPKAQVTGRRLIATEVVIGLGAGIIGGITGVWGPAILYWLIALNTEKRAQVRMLGLNFMIGWWVLVAAHLGSGVLNVDTMPISAMMLVPVIAGMWLGMKVQDRIDQALFQRLTLVVLCIAGVNLLRRAIM